MKFKKNKTKSTRSRGVNGNILDHSRVAITVNCTSVGLISSAVFHAR